MPEISELETKLSQIQGNGSNNNNQESTQTFEGNFLNCLMENIPDWIFFKDTQSRYLKINNEHARLLGLENPMEAKGKSDFDFFDEKVALQYYQEEQRIIKTNKPVIGRIGQTPSKSGRILWRSETKIPLLNSEKKVIGLVGISRDVTDLKEAESTIRHLAYHDVLTGLPNRLLLQEKLNQELKHCRRNEKKLAIVLLDLNGFKQVNDTLGHDAGDKLLVAVTDRLKAKMRESDILARMGGDEFLLILPNLNNIKDVETVIKKLVKAFSKKFDIGAKKLTMTASMGISTYPKDGKKQDTLIKKSDKAMYRAKKLKGGTRYSYYSAH